MTVTPMGDGGRMSPPVLMPEHRRQAERRAQVLAGAVGSPGVDLPDGGF